jgi:hypothetical protein
LVTPGTFLNFVPLLLGLFTIQPGTVEQSVTRLIVQDQVILRVPVVPRAIVPQIEWVEKTGPKCIPSAAIRRAALSGPQQVDLMLIEGIRIRAQFNEDCPALDFYHGFYLQTEDSQVCAGRDAIHSRIGGSCTIERFKQLIPKFPH